MILPVSYWYDTSSQMFWYKCVFIAELVVAEALFLFRLKRKPHFWLRVVLACCCLFQVSVFVPIISYSAWYNAFVFMALFLFTLLFARFCFEESWKTLIFCCVAGYTMQHVAFETYSFIGHLFNLEQAANVYVSDGTLSIVSSPATFLTFVGSHYFVYFILYLLFGRQIKRGEPLELKSITLLMVIIVISLSNIALSSLVTYKAYDPYNKSAVVLLDFYNVLCCILILYIQFKLVLYRNLETELSVERRLRRLEAEQYAMSKENIRLINMKCHDLKHQIRSIGNGNVVDRSVLKQIEDAVSIYDGTFHTGNDALDIILTEKSLVANEHNVRLTCSTNAVPLTFMREADIYVLFGNALDNALRAVANLPEDKRVVSLTIKEHGNMTSVDVRNYFAGELRWQDGLPQTTKQNDGYHGYGMHSMREVVESYDGELVVSTDGDVFSVNMLFFTDHTHNSDGTQPARDLPLC